MMANSAAAMLALLEQRFSANLTRHDSVRWEDVAERLAVWPDALTVLQAMEDTGGEPDATVTPSFSLTALRKAQPGGAACALIARLWMPARSTSRRAVRWNWRR